MSVIINWLSRYHHLQAVFVPSVTVCVRTYCHLRNESHWTVCPWVKCNEGLIHWIMNIW